MFPLHDRIRHQTNDFLFFILEFDLMILDLVEGALSASEAMNLGFTGRESIRRVLPLPISYLPPFFYHILWFPYMCFCSMGNSRNNTFCTAGRQLLLIQTHRCLLCTWSIASSRKKSLFEFHPLGQSEALAPNTISQQRKLFPAVTQHQPLLSRGLNNKSMMLLKVLPPQWYLAVTAEKGDMGMGSGEAHSPRASHHTLWLCMNRNRATHQVTQRAVCSVESTEH